MTEQTERTKVQLTDAAHELRDAIVEELSLTDDDYSTYSTMDGIGLIIRVGGVRIEICQKRQRVSEWRSHLVDRLTCKVTPPYTLRHESTRVYTEKKNHTWNPKVFVVIAEFVRRDALVIAAREDEGALVAEAQTYIDAAGFKRWGPVKATTLYVNHKRVPAVEVKGVLTLEQLDEHLHELIVAGFDLMEKK